MTPLHLILYVLAISGVVLNNHRRIECFYVWGITNIAWAIIDYQAGLYVQSLLFATYFCLAVHGWWKWKNNIGG